MRAKVIDGDTIRVSAEHGASVVVRLYGIDCPEKKQDYGKEATQVTKTIALGRVVDIDELYKDRYGRTVAIVTLPNDQILQEALLMSGAAWVDLRYCKRRECTGWLRLEQTARMAGIGLWGNEYPVPPWKWRHPISPMPDSSRQASFCLNFFALKEFIIDMEETPNPKAQWLDSPMAQQPDGPTVQWLDSSTAQYANIIMFLFNKSIKCSRTQWPDSATGQQPKGSIARPLNSSTAQQNIII